jgi:hypothetical protein
MNKKNLEKAISLLKEAHKIIEKEKPHKDITIIAMHIVYSILLINIIIYEQQ